MKPEALVKRVLRNIFKEYDILYTHVPIGQYGKVGFPDYVAYTKSGRNFLVEVKAANGLLSHPQKRWKQDLESRNVPYFMFDNSQESLQKLTEFLIRDINECSINK